MLFIQSNILKFEQHYNTSDVIPESNGTILEAKFNYLASFLLYL